jgi:hypothetical protein
MEITFLLELIEFSIQNNNNVNKDRRQFSIKSKLILSEYCIDKDSIKFGERIEKILEYQKNNINEMNSTCIFLDGDEVDDYDFSINTDRCSLITHLTKEKLFKFHEMLMLDTKKFRTKLTIGTTIVDSDENTQSGYEVNLKISHFQIVTEKIQNS